MSSSTSNFQYQKRYNNKNKKGTTNNNRKKTNNPFGSRSWSRPTAGAAAVDNKTNTTCLEEEEQERQQHTTTVATTANLENEEQEEKKETNDYDNESKLFIDSTSEEIGNIISDQLVDIQETGGDEITSLISSAAALTLVTKATIEQQEESNQDKATTDTTSNSNTDGGFQLRPLSDLMSSYGEQDVDFALKMKQEQRKQNLSNRKNNNNNNNNHTSSNEQNTNTTASGNTNSMLTTEGKAPIHVEIQSFGYLHGVPSRCRDGWSYACPLQILDCRYLPTVPPYMSKQDGLNFRVKRTLLDASITTTTSSIEENNNISNDGKGNNNNNNNILRTCCNKLANETFNVLKEAIGDGGHGYASPLRMIIYVGSDIGRHRSVVVSEMTAIALRSLLRKNDNNVLSEPISVGTNHRDIGIDNIRNYTSGSSHTNSSGSNNNNASKKKNPKKQNDLEDDW